MNAFEFGRMMKRAASPFSTNAAAPPAMIPHRPSEMGGVPPSKWPQVKGPNGRMIFKNPNAPVPMPPASAPMAPAGSAVRAVK